MISERPKTGDAFGRALCAHRSGEHAYELVERDDGYFGVPATDIGHYFAPYEEWSPIEQEAMAHARGRTLDVGCGAGRVGTYLQEKGHEVVGIDLSERAVEICRERGLTARVIDITDLRPDMFEEPFDTVVMAGANFGLLGTRETATDRLDRLARVTNEDATLIAHSRDPEATDEPAHREYHELNRERGRLPGAIRIRIRFKQYATPWYDYLFAGPETMRELVKPSPWRVTETIEADSGPMYVGILEKS